MRPIIFVIAVFTFLSVPMASAQQAPSTAVPSLIRYGGTLKDAQGAAVSSTAVGVTFSIYKQQDGGAPVWMETQTVMPDAAGNYSVLLGSTTATGLPADLFSQEEQRWLGVQMEGQAEQPRVLLVSVPYAFKAHEAETLGGKSVSDFVLASGANSSANAPNSNQASSSAANGVLAATGEIQKGAASDGPTNFSGSTTDQIVSVTQSGTGAGISAIAGTNAVFGEATGNVGNVYGVQGVATGTGGVALFGNANSPTGGTYGMKGSSTSTSGTGIHALASSTTGNTIGVSALVNSPQGTAAVFNNAAGGMIISGQNNGVQMFSVDGSGDVNASGTFTGSGTGITGITFSQLIGQLGSSQLGGTYSGPVTLSNTGNIFYGNGANLAGVIPAPGSPNYIQNGTSQQSSANFNISGNGTLGGNLAANVVSSSTTYQLGSSNVLGVGSFADENLFVGVNAGANNLAGQGTHNAFSGHRAGYSNTTGAGNSFFGWEAGYYNTTGSNDVYIGILGPQAGNESNTIRIGKPGSGGQTAAYIAGVTGASTSSGVPVFVDSTGKVGTGGGTGLVTSFNGRAGAVVPASGDYSFSLLSGTLASAQLSGTYGHAVTLSNSGNSFTGSGAGLTGVNPAPGSSNYIQNTTSPQTASFNVTGNGVLGGDLVANGGLAGSFAGTGSAVTGNATATSGTAYGVAGYTVSTSSTAAGVYGQATATTGSASGVYGQSSAPNGYGVYGTSSSVTGAGVYAINTNTGGGGYEGVALIAQADGPGAAGVFVNTNPSGILLLGGNANGTPFEVDASGSVEMYGPLTVSGEGGSGTSLIEGNLTVTGTLTKGGGSFKIDDPLDPANKTLSHSFVESPDMMNIYNGIVRLDARGEARITLPQYFEALNRDFRYQLTSIGAPQPRLYIAREVEGNRFKIAGGKANAKVSWQVTGIRQDAWANAHRIPNEEDKPLEKRGTYLHPELYGASADKNTNAMLQH